MTRTALILALAVCACSSEQKAGTANNAAIATEPAVKAPDYALRSRVVGASLVRVAELPKTTPLPADGNCEHFIQPVSAAARQAARQGWRVLQESQFDRFQAVLIARGGEPMTSGRCNYIDSNVAFFEGARLIGILYPKGKDSIPIAGIEPVDGHLRVWSTDPMALGQVNLAGTSLTYDRISGEDRVCGGKYRVPTVFGLPYSQARGSLRRAGWSPRLHIDDAEDYRTKDYRRRFQETDSCAGTGYAECRFTLTAKDGVELAIVTLGESDDPKVSSYGVSCNGELVN
jgi:hypothetical protein